MKSKTLINKQMRNKKNPELVETIFLAKKENPEIAGILSGPTRNRVALNLDEINKEAKEGETIIIPGKILGNGNIDSGKKLKIVALSFSASAEEKLNKAKISFSTVKEELGKNKGSKLKGRILK